MLTCHEVSELGSEFIEGHLNFLRRWAVLMHLRRCSRCELYIKQLELTSRMLQTIPFKDEAVDSQAILKKLNQLDR
ncbi:zf-HC2 domain-containing protein [Pseudomonas sp. LS1212]|uniref:zf-HC2 domain-containing protein n=1 Tax=Pseudomonas sp. LS1212 TaxID=2972478 RepID=UPI00215CC226|nr:zf-HC2 domain-containing protein [Pseudomonas sp. LS1212]UVJ41780.1 zf-HC2 domain-containing protein [Pseudomonas sp. LS1212]